VCFQPDLRSDFDATIRNSSSTTSGKVFDWNPGRNPNFGPNSIAWEKTPVGLRMISEVGFHPMEVATGDG